MTVSKERSGTRALSTRRAHWLLVCGALAGVSLAATGVFREPIPKAPPTSRAALQADSPEPLPDAAVARVNGRLIRRQDFDNLLALEAAGGMASDTASKQRLLDEMIDEELRVQRALELNLHLTDSRVRMDLASAVAEAAVAEAEQEAPSDGELRDYFAARRDYFAQRGPLRVQQIWFAIVEGNLGEAYNRARTARDLLLRERLPFATVSEMLGNQNPRPIPKRLIPPESLAGYVGRTALDVVLTLQPGEVSDPIRTIDGFHVLQVLERQAPPDVSFEGLRLEVEAEYWRERARQALEANASELRGTADIQKTEAL